jgi:hypothetical protein
VSGGRFVIEGKFREKKCRTCKKLFLPRHPSIGYCSPECRKQGYVRLRRRASKDRSARRRGSRQLEKLGRDLKALGPKKVVLEWVGMKATLEYFDD